MTQQKTPTIFSESAEPGPFFRSLQKEIDRVFDRFREPTPFSASGLFEGTRGGVWPALDVAETDKAVEISAEIPGVSEADLDVSISDGTLILKGEKSSDHEEKEKDYQLVERSYGRFRRAIPLGFTPDDDKVEATFTNGVLKIRVEKPEEVASHTKKIEVKAS